MVRGQFEDTPQYEDVSIQTPDGVLKGTLLEIDPSYRTLVLLHMLGGDRRTWKPFMDEDLNGTLNLLAIDMRGHGESFGDYREYTDADFAGMVTDMAQVMDFLDSRGLDNTCIIGASIGANVALKYAMNDTSIKCVVLLSPGKSYKGIGIETEAAIFKRPMLIVVSLEDTYAYESANDFKKANPLISLKTYMNAGHGTTMLERESRLGPFIYEWVSEK